MVRVPAGVRPGQNFAASINGRRFVVQCPQGVQAGMPLHIRVPSSIGASRQQQQQSSVSNGRSSGTVGAAGGASGQQTFMVTVPAGVGPGQQFAVMANNERINVTCPANCRAGSQVYVRVPIQRGRSNSSHRMQTAEDEDDYEALDAALAKVTEKQGKSKNTFERKVGDDGKLHWVCATAVEEGKEADGVAEASVAEATAHAVSTSVMGLVRHFEPNGTLVAVPADQAAIEVDGTGLSGMTPELLARASALPFKKKLKWFRQCRDKLRVPWEVGHKKIRVSRDNILYDSLLYFQKFKKEDMHKIFRFQFAGEEGIDAGGLAREFFQVVSEQLFNPDFGLFCGSGIGGEIITINPQSGIANEHHLEYFHFAGRFLGKAFFDSQLVNCHLALQIYKHLLATPLTFHDLDVVDGDLVNGLTQLLKLDDVSLAYMDFTITEEVYGASQVRELIKDGGKTDVPTTMSKSTSKSW